MDGWGSGVIGRLARDLRIALPDMKGLSRSNLFYMWGFAAAWREPIVQQAVGHLPSGHITVLLDKKLDPDAHNWYTVNAVKAGWSRTCS